MRPMREAMTGKGLQRPVPSLVISSVLAAVFLIVNLGLHRAIPSFQELFLDNPARLPRLTTLIISVPIFAWVILGVLAAVLLVAKDFTLSARWRDLVNGAFFLMLIVYTVSVLIGLFRPLVGCVIGSIE